MSTEQFDPSKVERIYGDELTGIKIGQTRRVRCVLASEFDSLLSLRNADRAASIDAQQKLSDALAEVEKELLITQRALRNAADYEYQFWLAEARAAYDAQEAKRPTVSPEEPK